MDVEEDSASGFDQFCAKLFLSHLFMMDIIESITGFCAAHPVEASLLACTSVLAVQLGRIKAAIDYNTQVMCADEVEYDPLGRHEAIDIGDC